MTTFNYTTGNPANLVAGTNANMNDIQGPFTDLKTFVNGNVDDANLATGTKDKLGLSDATTVRRGATIISTTEGRTNAAYGLMPTPDRVSNVVLPTNGLIVVNYFAYWNETVDAAARAAIFIGANQLKIGPYGVAAPAVQEAQCVGGASITEPLTSCWYGITSGGAGSVATGHSAPVTTGQVIATSNVGVDAASQVAGGPAYIFASAGTYDVTVQFKASSGTVNVLNRSLWVWTIAF